MDRHYDQPLDLPALAGIVNLSVTHVVRQFKRVFGETPHQYLYRRRIERAQWLLRTTDLPIARIANEVGYDSLGTFTRTFGRLVGETPGRHRARGPIAAAPSCVIRSWTRPIGAVGGRAQGRPLQEGDFGEDRHCTRE